MSKELYYATGNSSKFEMVKNYITAHSSVVIKQLNINLIEEQSLNLEQIAVAKVEQAWKQLGEPVLVDDTGIYFEQYHKFPGVMTKFIYEALGFEGLYKLYQTGDAATFVTYVAFKKSEHEHHVFEGKIEGTLIKPQNLVGHFDLPFLHLFVPSGSDKPLIELMADTGYSKYNPRIIAIDQVLNFIQKG